MTDSDLLRAYLRGDQAAFAKLVQRHGDWVWGCALRQSADHSLAEDITQGAFLLLARKASALLSHDPLNTWLFRVVQYLARDVRKLANRRKYHETKVAAMNREESAENRNWDALRSTLDDAVSRLRDADRQAILLRFYQGLSLAQVAATLGLTEGAATKRVSRAVARLKDVLFHQGLAAPADVQELLASGMACAAPVALIAQISGGGAATAATTAMAAKAAELMLAAKLKLTAAIVVTALAAAALTTGVIVATREATPPTQGVATVALPAPTQVSAPAIQAPPIRQGKRTVAVNRTTLVLPQSAIDTLMAASQSHTTAKDIETRIGASETLRPILRDLLPQNIAGISPMGWNGRHGGQGFGPMDEQQLEIGNMQRQNVIYLSASVAVSASGVTQIGGGYQFGNATPRHVTFAPTTVEPGQTLLQIVPVALAGLQHNIVFVYEAIEVDAGDLDALRNLTIAAAWFASPQAEHLRLARAGALWKSKVPDNASAAAHAKAKTLPGGAEIWVRCISDASVHPLACWTSDGQPAAVMAAGKPTAHLLISDPNLPPRIFSNTNVYEGWPTIALTRQTEAGYAFSIAFGDGAYKTVGSMSPSKGAKVTLGDCTIEIADIDEHGTGSFSVTGEPPSDTDVLIVAIRKDGSFAWNGHGADDLWLVEGQKLKIPTSFSYSLPPAEIVRLEIRTRPFKWVTFDNLAKRPAIPLPTGLEPIVEPEAAREQQLVVATPANRQAFLDGVQCLRMWSEGTQVGQLDAWIWRDGRYRAEQWMGGKHTLIHGNRTTAWHYDFGTGEWTAAREQGTHAEYDLAKILQASGGLEAAVVLGETLGNEEVHGVPCTIRSGKIESTSVKLWLDSLGVIRQMTMHSEQSGIGSNSAILDYDPADSERVWMLPTGGSATNHEYEEMADAYLAKAIPADKPITTISAAGRVFKLLSFKQIREDLVIACTSTDLTPAARSHRAETGDRWQATQLLASGPGDASWAPNVMARVHTPYREITWWAVSKPKDCAEVDLIDLLVQLGQSGNHWTMESWLDQQPNSARLHPLMIEIAKAEQVELDTYLRQIYAILEAYRAAIGEPGKHDFITESSTWEVFKESAKQAIDGRRSITSSGR